MDLIFGEPDAVVADLSALILRPDPDIYLMATYMNPGPGFPQTCIVAIPALTRARDIWTEAQNTLAVDAPHVTLTGLHLASPDHPRIVRTDQ